jgi:hypothetical protein
MRKLGIGSHNLDFGYTYLWKKVWKLLHTIKWHSCTTYFYNFHLHTSKRKNLYIQDDQFESGHVQDV